MVFFVGVDVGTGSVRAALVDNAGRILKKSTSVIRTWNPEVDFYQQSSDDIWRCCCKVVRVSVELKCSFLNETSNALRERIGWDVARS